MTAIEGASVLDSLSTVKTSDTWGPVILTISNSVLSQDKLSPTPSSRDGMSQQIEEDLRNLGCNIIQTAGKLLRLPQVISLDYLPALPAVLSLLEARGPLVFTLYACMPGC